MTKLVCAEVAIQPSSKNLAMNFAGPENRPVSPNQQLPKELEVNEVRVCACLTKGGTSWCVYPRGLC